MTTKVTIKLGSKPFVELYSFLEDSQDLIAEKIDFFGKLSGLFTEVIGHPPMMPVDDNGKLVTEVKG